MQGAAAPCGLHTPRFDFNDAILPIGLAYWVALVSRELGIDKSSLGPSLGRSQSVENHVS
jgi:hypothetical protein